MNELDFYSTPGRMTELGPHAAELACTTVGDAVRITQGLLLHFAWAQAYGVDGSERANEVQLRSVSEILEFALSIDDRPLGEPREPRKRVLVNCRHFSTVSTALLRAGGVPARARCGFGTYFESGKRIDHWVTEIWNGDAWVLVDAQMDAFQIDKLSLPFPPSEVPRDAFLVAGEAWRRCREGEDDPEQYGIFDMWGIWFIEGNVSRDLASLNKVELLPWDAWGVMVTGGTQPPDERSASIAGAAEASRLADFELSRSLYETDDFRVPDVITSFTSAGPVEVPI